MIVVYLCFLFFFAKVVLEVMSLVRALCRDIDPLNLLLCIRGAGSCRVDLSQMGWLLSH